MVKYCVFFAVRTEFYILFRRASVSGVFEGSDSDRELSSMINVVDLYLGYLTTLFELQKVYGVGSGRKIIVNVVGKDFEGI
jgi:hypothetical protein